MVDPSILIASTLVAVSAVLVASFIGFVLIAWQISRVSASALVLIQGELDARRQWTLNAMLKAEAAEAKRQAAIDKIFEEQAKMKDQANGLVRLDNGRLVDPTDYELDLQPANHQMREAL